MSLIAGAVAAGVAVAGQVLDNRRANSASTKELQDYGRHVAAVEAKASRRQDALVGQAAAIMEASAQSTLAIDKSEMAASADAAVSAAVSGTEGQSVNLTQTEVEANAANAHAANEKMLQNRLRGIDQQSRDINFDADAEFYDYTPRDRQGDLGKVFLSGMQGFFSVQGFGQ